MSGVCSNSHGNNRPDDESIDHIIELQILVKALEHCSAEYTRKTWIKALRSVSNNVNNLQPLSVKENGAKREAVERWLAQWQQFEKPAVKYFAGSEEKYLKQMKEAWKKLKPEFRRKKLRCLSKTIEEMIYGATAAI